MITFPEWIMPYRWLILWRVYRPLIEFCIFVFVRCVNSCLRQLYWASCHWPMTSLTPLGHTRLSAWLFCCNPRTCVKNVDIADNAMQWGIAMYGNQCNSTIMNNGIRQLTQLYECLCSSIDRPFLLLCSDVFWG